MSKRLIHLGDGLDLSAEDFIESATGIISRRGRGKSGLVRVLCEELLRLRLPFVIFDPLGLFWGLKSSFDGKKPSGHEIMVIGGEHGDLPLDRGAGVEVARTIAGNDASLVIDLKGQSKSTYRQFVLDFARELLAKNQRPRIIIFEEAARLLPQRLFGAEMLECYDAVEQLISMGRNQALGAVIVSQRASTVNKDALTQLDHLIVLGITGPQDAKSMREWVEQNADPALLKEFLDGLSGLARQEAWMWSPELGLFRRFRVRDFTTFHPDKTHLRRHGLLNVRPVETDVSEVLDRLKLAMRTLAEKQKAEDPRELRKRIHQLEAEASKSRPVSSTGPPSVVVERVEVPVLGDAQVKRLEAFAARLEGAIAKCQERFIAESKIVEGLLAESRSVRASIRPVQGPQPSAQSVIHASVSKPLPVRAVAGAQVPNHAPAARTGMNGSDGPLPKGERLVLRAIAQYVEGVRRDQLSVLSGFKRSSRDAYLSRLKARGLITIDENSGAILATMDGMDALGGDYEPLPKGDALRTYWLQRLPEGERRILEVLIDAYPKEVGREVIDERTGYRRSSRDAYLSRLQARRLIQRTSAGAIASPTLFEDGIA